jgi:hypothetical protein
MKNIKIDNIYRTYNKIIKKYCDRGEVENFYKDSKQTKRQIRKS